MKAGSIEVKIVGDTRALRAGLARIELRLAKSWWRRVALKIALWRIEREDAP